MENLENHEDDGFNDIRGYFTDQHWEELSYVEKVRYRVLKERHEFLQTIMPNVVHTIPSFMNATVPERQPAHSKPLRLVNTPPLTGTRTSERLKSRQEVSTDGSDSSSSSHFMVTPDAEKENIPPISSPSKQPAGSSHQASQLPCQSKDCQSKSKRPRPIPNINQKVPYPSPLPNFTRAALIELKKPAHQRSIRIVLSECKDFLEGLIESTYPTKLDYNNFCKTLVMKYPRMKNIGTANCWATFKLQLRKSFSAARNYDENIKPRNIQRKEERQAQLLNSIADDNSDLESSELDEPDEDEDMKQADESLMNSGSLSKPEIKNLLTKTTEFRKKKIQNMDPFEVLKTYPHLKIPEMMICDYILSAKLDLEGVKQRFEESCTKLARAYNMMAESEYDKVALMNHIHTIFLTKQTKKGGKPVFILRDEKEVRSDLKSAEGQAPYLVILSSTDFCTAQVDVKSATLLMGNGVVCSLVKPDADKATLLLLSGYYSLNVEIPKPYKVFMRAIEFLLTGSLPVDNANRSKALTNFTSILQNQISNK